MIDSETLELINTLKEAHLDWITIGLTALIILVLALINLKKPQFFGYLGAAFVLSGSLLASAELAGTAAGDVIGDESAAIISVVGSGILKELQKVGIIFVIIGIVSILLAVVLGSIKKKKEKNS